MSVCQTVRICGTAQRTPPTVHATLLWFTTLARSRLLCRHLESWCLSSLGHLTRAGRNGFSNMTTDHLLLYMNHPIVLECFPFIAKALFNPGVNLYFNFLLVSLALHSNCFSRNTLHATFDQDWLYWNSWQLKTFYHFCFSRSCMHLKWLVFSSKWQKMILNFEVKYCQEINIFYLNAQPLRPI